VKPYYEHAGISIFHGDCREIAPCLGRFDLLLTDPPYGIGASAGVGKYGREKWTERDPKWDERPPARWLLEMLLESADKAIVWGGNYFPLPESRNFLIWNKGAGFKDRDFAECEMAWCSWDGNARIYERDPLASGDYKGKEHPTEKPLALIKWCIRQAGAVNSILDPFAGSGTTGVAAKEFGLRAVLIEAEERYCEAAARRLRQEVLPLEVA
jgi:site-specific DNA-methyltransferase (adenine-specific)